MIEALQTFVIFSAVFTFIATVSLMLLTPMITFKQITSINLVICPKEMCFSCNILIYL